MTFARALNGGIRWIAVSMSVYHLVIAFIGAPEAFFFRGTHLLFALVLIFLLFPRFGRGEGKLPRWDDWLLIAVSMVTIGYLWLNHKYLYDRFVFVDELFTSDLVLGTIFILIVLEATRRVIGLALPITALCFVSYALFVAGVRPESVIEINYLTTEGIFGIPLSVSATYVILFIIFGAFVERSGAGKMFMDFALSLTGHSVGGPAKVAVITSGLFGTISGSAVANVMTTGTFTIPMMMRLGYRPAFAGAVEAVASTGGQIMPPIMGAAAFVMAEFLGVSYLTVAAFALVPALLYYVAVFVAVHFEALRTGMKGLPREECPRLIDVLKERGHLFLPLLIIVGVLVYGYSAPYAAMFGILSVVPVALMRKSTRGEINLKAIIDALESGARGTLAIAAACACAGIVIGAIAQTGLGLTFTSFVLTVAQDSLIPALMLTDDRRHHPRHGPADHPGLHHPGGAAGAGAGQAGHRAAGGAPVRLLLRHPVGDHAAGGARRVRGVRTVALEPVGYRLGGGETRCDRLHRAVHVRLRACVASDRRRLACRAGDRNGDRRRHHARRLAAQLLPRRGKPLAARGAFRGCDLPDQARLDHRHRRCRGTRDRAAGAVADPERAAGSGRGAHAAVIGH